VAAIVRPVLARGSWFARGMRAIKTARSDSHADKVCKGCACSTARAAMGNIDSRGACAHGGSGLVLRVAEAPSIRSQAKDAVNSGFEDREAAGLSPSQFANPLGVSMSAVQGLEQGFKQASGAACMLRGPCPHPS